MKTRLRGGGWVYDVLREVVGGIEEEGKEGKKDVNIDIKGLVESLETWVEKEAERVKGKSNGKEKERVVVDSEEDGDSGEMDGDGGSD